MPPSRRQFVEGLMGAAALSLVSRKSLAKSAGRSQHRGGPRKLLFIYLDGGSDDLYTVDPRLPGEAAKGIAPLWQADDLLHHGNLRLAPPWHALEPYLPRMQVLLGVQSFSVAHETGKLQLQQMRTRISSPIEPSFLCLAGEAMGPELHIPAFNLHKVPYPSRGRLFADHRGNMLDQLWVAANDDELYELSTRQLKRSIDQCKAADCATFRGIKQLLEKLRNHPKIVPNKQDYIDPLEWPEYSRIRMTYKFTGKEFAWAKFLIENNLTSAIGINPYGVFDTHFNNEMQGPTHKQIAVKLRTLLDGFARLPGHQPGTTLLDEMAVVLVGELGRFPYINSNFGKDHLPQISVTVIGPGLSYGRFGETDKKILGAPVSFKTGKSGKGAKLMTLDDVGRTLLEWIGVGNAEEYGYDGGVLEFALG